MVAVVTESGNISFYDPSLTVLYFQKLKGVGPLKSLSFDLCPQENGQYHVTGFSGIYIGLL